MDNYDFGMILGMTLNAFEHGSRGNGRTTRMVDGLKEGDTVVFTNEQEANRVRRIICQRYGDIDIRVMVCSPSLHHLWEKTRSTRRNIVLDHSFVLAMYRDTIRHLEKDMNDFSKHVKLRSERDTAVDRAILDQRPDWIGPHG